MKAQSLTNCNSAPCRDCEFRTAECHAKCKVYADWVKAEAERKKPYKEQLRQDAEYCGARREGRWSHKRKYTNNKNKP